MRKGEKAEADPNALFEPCECVDLQGVADLLVNLMEGKHKRFKIAGGQPDWPLRIECKICGGRRRKLTELGRELGQLVAAEMKDTIKPIEI